MSKWIEWPAGAKKYLPKPGQPLNLVSEKRTSAELLTAAETTEEQVLDALGLPPTDDQEPDVAQVEQDEPAEEADPKSKPEGGAQ